jgi:ABC-type histidine transport system ATPase subunit
MLLGSGDTIMPISLLFQKIRKQLPEFFCIFKLWLTRLQLIEPIIEIPIMILRKICPFFKEYN